MRRWSSYERQIFFTREDVFTLTCREHLWLKAGSRTKQTKPQNNKPKNHTKNKPKQVFPDAEGKKVLVRLVPGIKEVHLLKLRAANCLYSFMRRLIKKLHSIRITWTVENPLKFVVGDFNWVDGDDCTSFHCELHNCMLEDAFSTGLANFCCL